jgi:hypothetical protein
MVFTNIIAKRGADHDGANGAAMAAKKSRAGCTSDSCF